MRLLLVAALLMTPACLTECDGVGAIGSMRQGAMNHGAARGDMTPPADGDDAPAVVGTDWPKGGAYGTLQILYEAEKETTFADNDPVETPTHFGALTLALTQGTLGSRLAYQSPCDVGPAIACYYADGGDTWVDSAVRSTLKFLHDGTGASCYALIETTSTLSLSTIWSTSNKSTAVGAEAYSTSGADFRYGVRLRTDSATVAIPSAGTGVNGQTWGFGHTVATADTPDATVFWRGAAQPTGNTGNATFSTADPGFAFTIAGYSGGATPRYAGYIMAIACYDVSHGATEIAGVWAAVEARTGVLPQ